MSRQDKKLESVAASQESLVQAMLNPDFYPKMPEQLAYKETHISHLFFTDGLVYKVKKAVRYPFLDFSTLAKRRFFLNEELRLNRRLAPSVYIGVMPITFDDLGWRLGGWAEPAEYTLVMRRLPDKRMLPFLLDTGQLSESMMHALGAFVGAFHAEAEPIDGTDHRSRVEAQWRTNLNEIAAFVPTVFDAERVRAIERFGEDFLHAEGARIEARAGAGWVRDIHGDLHAEHVCFAPEGIQIFDCIEFDPYLRRCDVASEVAFLLMDIAARGAASLAEPFLQGYRSKLDDADGAALLSFYQCYRALVRAKVYALRGPPGVAQARDYLRYAASLTWQRWQPFLVMIGGLTGSGKSTLARELSRRTGLTAINSDQVRKHLAGKLGYQPEAYGEGIYSATMTEKTYARIAKDAERLLRAGRGAILDATFLRRSHRGKIINLAERYGVTLLAIDCRVGDETARRRLAQRQAEGRDISDGRWEIYVQQKQAVEPALELAAENRLELAGDAPLDTLADRCERFLRERLGT